MKIPQDVKKLGDISRGGVHPTTPRAVGESNPVNTADKQTNTRKARTVQRMGKMYEMSKVQSLQF